MSATELKDIAAGLYYVARQSKNPALAEQALSELRAMRQNASGKQKRDVVKRIDGYLADCEQSEEERRPMHAYEIADRLDVSYNTTGICVIGMAYAVALMALAVYIHAINRSLFERM